MADKRTPPWVEEFLESNQLITVEELAELLRRSPVTIASDVTRRPFSLPPRVKIPGSRKVLFKKDVVISWINKHMEDSDEV